MATKKATTKKKGTAFWLGIIFGLLLGAGAVYAAYNYLDKSDIERKANKIEREANKKIKEAEKEAQKLFD
jgi:hypothetical protein